MPPLPADSIHARACKLKCEKILTRPVGFGMPRIGSIKIPAANIQCLPLPNLSRAGIAVSSLQRFSRGVAIITWPEANEEGCLFRGFEFYRRHFLVMLGDQICYSFATQFWLYYSYPTYRTALN